MRSLSRVNPFWDHMAERDHVDHEHGDMLVVPSRVLAQCERLTGPSPAWVKSSDLVHELTTIHDPDQRVGAVTIAVAPRPWFDCGARNLEHFYTCTGTGSRKVVLMAEKLDPNDLVTIEEIAGSRNITVHGITKDS